MCLTLAGGKHAWMILFKHKIMNKLIDDLEELVNRLIDDLEELTCERDHLFKAFVDQKFEYMDLKDDKIIGNSFFKANSP